MRFVVAIALAAALPLAGCGVSLTNPLLAPPSAEVVSIDRADGAGDDPVFSGTSAARYLVTVEFANPNDVDLPLREAEYTLRDARGVARSTRARVFATVPAESTQLVRLPVSVPAEAPDRGLVEGLLDAGGSAVDAGRDLLSGGDGPLRVTGSVAFEPPGEVRQLLTDTGVPLPRVSFTGRGGPGPGDAVE